jgi:cell division protein YceG involved in septum cleavage
MKKIYNYFWWFVLALSFIFSLVLIYFYLYSDFYHNNTVNKNKLLKPLEFTVKQDENLNSFLDGLEKNISPLKIDDKEFFKDNIF